MDTPSDRLVKHLKPKKFSSHTTTWGIDNKPMAIYRSPTYIAAVKVALLLNHLDFFHVNNNHFLEQHLMALCMIPLTWYNHLDF